MEFLNTSWQLIKEWVHALLEGIEVALQFLNENPTLFTILSAIFGLVLALVTRFIVNKIRVRSKRTKNFQAVDKNFLEKEKGKRKRESIAQSASGGWPLVTHDMDIERDLMNNALSTLIKTAKTQESEILIILGNGGEGKSTFVCRLAKELQGKGHLVYNYCHGGNLEELAKISRKGGLFVVIHDIFRKMKDDENLNDYLSKENTPDGNLTIIADSRIEDYDSGWLPQAERVLKLSLPGKDKHDDWPVLRAPSEDELHKLKEKFEEQKNKKYGSEEWEGIIKDKNGNRQPMLVIMTHLATGKYFNSYHKGQVEALARKGKEYKERYLTLCALYVSGVSVPTAVLETLSGAKKRMLKELAEWGYIQKDDNAYQFVAKEELWMAGHEMIAEAVTGHYSTETEECYESLLSQLNGENTIHRYFLFQFYRQALYKKNRVKGIKEILEDQKDGFTDFVNKSETHKGSAAVVYIQLEWWEQYKTCLLTAKFEQSDDLRTGLSTVQQNINKIPDRGDFVKDFIEKVEYWLKKNPQYSEVRVPFLYLMRKAGDKEQKIKVIDETYEWLKENPEHRYVRAAFLNLVRKDGDRKQQSKVIDETYEWLKKNPQYSHVWAAFLGLVGDVGDKGQKIKVIDDTYEWLKKNPKDIYVRALFLSLVRKAGDKEQQGRVIGETYEWLKKNPKDIYVRALFLSLVRNVGDKGQKIKVIDETYEWLKKNPQASWVRMVFLSLVGKAGDSGQKIKVIDETYEWLKKNPQYSNVRAAFLGFVSKAGDSGQKIKFIDETSEWLKKNPQYSNVRAAFLGFVSKAGGSRQQSKAIDETDEWLKENPKDSEVRAPFLGLVRDVGDKGQKIKVIDETYEWLKKNPKDIYVRAAFLSLVRNVGDSGQKIKVIDETYEWLKENPKDSEVRAAFLSLVRNVGDSGQKIKMIDETDEWLKENPKHRAAKDIGEALQFLQKSL